MAHNNGNTEFCVAQINLDKSQKCFNEFCASFHGSEFSVAIVAEPYRGASTSAKGAPGVETFQTPMPGEPVRAAIYIKQRFAAKAGAILMAQYSSRDLAIVRLTLGRRPMYIVSLYLPPRSNHVTTLNTLATFLDSIGNSRCLVAGDFNGWHPLWNWTGRRNARGMEVKGFMDPRRFHVLNSGEATFETVTHGRAVSSSIDLTWASDDLVPLVGDWHTDHCFVASSEHVALIYSISSATRSRLPPPSSQSTYRYSTHPKSDWAKFKDQLSAVFLEEGLTEVDFSSLSARELDSEVLRVTAAVNRAANAVFKKRGRAFPRARAPFWTPRLSEERLALVRLRREVHGAGAGALPPDQLAALVTELGIAEEHYRESIRRESAAHFRKFCESQDIESVWTVTNPVLRADGLARKPPSTIATQTGHTASGEETADHLLKHFFPDDPPELDTPRQAAVRAECGTPTVSGDDLPFSEGEVLEAILGMSPKRAPGLDGLTADICQVTVTNFPSMFVALFNRCLELGHFPRVWKMAVVKIIPKPGMDGPDTLGSRRPIGLIPVFGKLLEKLFTGRLVHHSAVSGRLSSLQYGFRRHMSTAHALHDAVHYIQDCRRSGLLCTAVSLDIQSAFNRAWWPAILHRLTNIGCPANIFNLIKDYLKDRTVLLNYAGASASKDMQRGCVQGSACGPALWNLILDELLETKLPAGCRLQAYADDVLLIAAAKDAPSLQAAVGKALDLVTGWGRSVKLEFGMSKTKALAFSKKASTISVTMNGITIPFVKQFRLLGVMVDDRLNFNKHVRFAIDKASRLFQRLCLFARPSWGLSPENIDSIYRYAIVPTVTYASGVWGEAAQKIEAKRALASLQRGFALKAIRGYRTISTCAALALAQFLPLHLQIAHSADAERARLTGTTRFLPRDIFREEPAPLARLLHPAIRQAPTFCVASTQERIDEALGTDTATIYTDGSKLENGSVGAALVCLDPNAPPGRAMVERRFRLHECCTVYQAELFAIYKACELAEQRGYRDSLILSDSLSSLKAIGQRSSSNPMIVYIHEVIHRHLPRGNIRFCWVKGHAGILGNEYADGAAGKAAASHRAYAYTSFPISYVKKLSRTERLRDWEESYQNATQGAQTRALFPDLASVRLFRRVVPINFFLTQYLSGHGAHLSYLRRFRIAETDGCPCDPSTPQTPSHLISECPMFAVRRAEHFARCGRLPTADDPISIKHLLSRGGMLESLAELATYVFKNVKHLNSSPESDTGGTTR